MSLPLATYEAIFTPLDDASRPRAVARKIGRAIELGHLAPGARLPNEADLSAQLSVSTITLREALAELRRDGLVETRRGRGGGTLVRGAGAATVPPLESLLAGTAAADLRDLGDQCAAVRGAAARLAAERASADELLGLRERYRLLAETHAPADWRREDGRLHVEIAAAAQSPRLARAELALQEEAADLLLSPNHEQPHRGAALRRYRRLLTALDRGNARRARDIAEEHVGAIVDRLIRAHLEVATR